MQNTDNKKFREISAIRADLRFYFELNKVLQKHVAQKTGVNQGQISRILSGESRRVSSAVLKICEYAKINPFVTSDYELANDVDLIDALRLVVGKDPAKARKITRVIRALAEY